MEIINFDSKDRYNPNNPENEISHRVKLLILCEKVITVKTRPDATQEEIEDMAKDDIGEDVYVNVVDIENVEII